MYSDQGFGRARAWPRIFGLTLLVVMLGVGGALWFDFLGLLDVIGARNSQAIHIDAQPGQGFFVNETCEVIGAVGHKLATPHADEQVMIFVIDTGGIRRRGRLAQRGQRPTQLALVAGDTGDPAQRFAVRNSSKQACKQPVKLRALPVLAYGFGL